ncbi:IS1-like element transposase [Klebsiella aerogenes]
MAFSGVGVRNTARTPLYGINALIRILKNSCESQ